MPTPANIGGISTLLYQGQLDDAQATLFTAPTQPPNARVEISSIWICNTDGNARLCTLRMGNGVLTAANSLLDGASIEANTTYIIFEQSPVTLSAGMTIAGFCDTTDAIALSVFGHVWQ